MAKRHELDEEIRALCESKGWRFKPWEAHPANVDDGPSPHPPGTAYNASWPKAQKLRRKLIAEIEGK
jgi:hypothetical protein